MLVAVAWVRACCPDSKLNPSSPFTLTLAPIPQPSITLTRKAIVCLRPVFAQTRLHAQETASGAPQVHLAPSSMARMGRSSTL